MSVTLRQLEIFLAVARRQHVTAAARDVHLSQSAVSAALAELATRLGGPLLERAGRRVVLNDRGRRLAEDAHDLLQRAADLVRRHTRGGELGGRLRIGASSTIGTYLLPEAVGAFVAAHPAVDVELAIGNSEAIETQLVQRDLDLAFVEGPPQDAAVEAVPWRDDELRVFVAASHPLARRRRPIDLTELARERWVVREGGSGTRAVLEAALRGRAVELPATLTLGHSEAVKHAVRAGLGVGCLSALALRRELASGELKVLRVPDLDLRRRLWRVTRRAAWRSPLLEACIAHLDAPSARARRRPRAPVRSR